MYSVPRATCRPECAVGSCTYWLRSPVKSASTICWRTCPRWLAVVPTYLAAAGETDPGAKMFQGWQPVARVGTGFCSVAAQTTCPNVEDCGLVSVTSLSA